MSQCKNLPQFDPSSPDFQEPDWTKLTRHPAFDLECYCGATFRGYAAIVPGIDKKPRCLTMEACPQCSSRTRLRRMQPHVDLSEQPSL